MAAVRKLFSARETHQVNSPTAKGGHYLLQTPTRLLKMQINQETNRQLEAFAAEVGVERLTYTPPAQLLELTRKGMEEIAAEPGRSEALAAIDRVLAAVRGAEAEQVPGTPAPAATPDDLLTLAAAEEFLDRRYLPYREAAEANALIGSAVARARARYLVVGAEGVGFEMPRDIRHGIAEEVLDLISAPDLGAISLKAAELLGLTAAQRKN